MPKLKKVSKNEWAFEPDYSRSDMPKEVESFLEQKLKSGELERMSPEQVMMELMSTMPDVIGNLGANNEPTQFDELADAQRLLEKGDFEQAIESLEGYVTTYPNDPDGWSMLSSAYEVVADFVPAMLAIRHAVDIYVSDFPKTFDWKKAKLEWGVHENRPFLSDLNKLSLSYGALKMYEPAIEWGEKLMSLNEMDNTGIRSHLVDFYLETQQYQKIINLNKKYPEDVMVAEIPYGAVLAYCYLDDEKNAKKAWQSAQDTLPLIAKELAKKRHTKPKSKSGVAGYMTVGGADQAYYYWQDSRKYWEANPLAQQLIAEYRGAKKPSAK